MLSECAPLSGLPVGDSGLSPKDQRDIALSVHDLWLEYRVSMQYAKTWERVEEAVDLVRRKEAQGSLPTAEDAFGLTPVSTRGGSPRYWMQQVDVPAWFKRQELGIGTDTNYFDTQAGLTESNARRRQRYQRQLERLAGARKTLKRTVRG